MTFKQLEYFKAVSDEGSVLQAAKKLHVAQPALSRQIEMLEYELGVKLFLRSSKGMSLTESGEDFLKSSLNVFKDLENLTDSINQKKKTIKGKINIGVLYSVMTYALDRIRIYHDKYPNVELYLKIGTPEELTEQLREHKLDAVFMRSITRKIQAKNCEVLGEDPLELIMTEALDPTPERDTVPIKSLENIPLCLLRVDDLYSYNEYLLNKCKEKGIKTNIICQCYDTPMAMQMIQGGFGIGFLPKSILNTHPNSGIYSKPLEKIGDKSYPVLYWNDNGYRNLCTRLFTDEWDEEKELKIAE